MNMTEEQVEAQLAEMEAEYQQPAMEEPEEIEEQDPVEVEEPEEPDTRFAQKEHMSYEDWVAAGKDPDKWRGKKAFDDYGVLLSKLEETEKNNKAVLDAVNAWEAREREKQAKEIETLKAQYEERLKQAIEDDDAKLAIETQNQINELDKTSTPAPAVNTAQVIIDDFIGKNPILNKNRPEYDNDFYGAMAKLVDNTLNSFGPNVTEDQVRRTMNWAFNTSKNLYADKFTSPRANRQATPQPAKKTAKPDVKERLKKFGNARNPRDTKASMEIYELIKKSDPKEAEKFLERLGNE